KYIGILSRFQKRPFLKVFDYMVLLSGPEPQRSLLEDILLKSFRNTTQKVLFVRGIFSEEELENNNPNISIKNLLLGADLEEALNSSEVIISRPGYTTLMDLAKLQKKAFFIPTPGQPEQKYLAKRLQKQEMAPFCQQEEFAIQKLEKLKEYPALQDTGFGFDRSSLFGLFEGK
ncbi:glycosyltransferase, partial [Longispora fulva]|uniref:glycosyltransferase n=1 Tax=Longispora fulva TaxID=619741 RepID=UPI0036402B11